MRAPIEYRERARECRELARMVHKLEDKCALDHAAHQADSNSGNCITCSAVIARWQGLHSNVSISGKRQFAGTVRMKCIHLPQQGHVTNRSVLIVSMDISNP